MLFVFLLGYNLQKDLRFSGIHQHLNICFLSGEMAAAATEVKPNEYKMDSDPRGICLIINNEKFKSGKREGSQTDVDSLKDLFEFLGFQVIVYTDKTAKEIKDLMTKYSKFQDHGDCFVCCVMSHGNEFGVAGCDGKICSLDDITLPFNGDKCPALIGKPKVFFIQACRGSEMQKKLEVTEDLIAGFPGMRSDRIPYTIGQSSDFLIALSTVYGYVSIRDETQGTWFIQTLCKHLKEGSKGGLDILNILTRVINDVSKKEENTNEKMTPVAYFTLRKPLIFRAKSM